MLTLRWLLFALVVPALLALAAALPFLLTVALAYSAALVVITLLDRAAAGGRAQFRIARMHDPKLSLGVSNPITLTVATRGARAVECSLRDDLPLDFHTDDHVEPLRASISPGETASITYHIRPLHRGRFMFGDTHLRWMSPLGLYVRQATYPTAHEVQVYPNLYEIRKYELLVRRDQLVGMGLRNVRTRGEGTIFESLREYTPDDPYRAINWKATARRAKPISTDYEPERSQRVLIMLDVGRMMRSPIRIDDPGGIAWNMAKVDFVINSVLLLSYVATRKGDHVGLLVFADRVQHFIAPAPGHDHFHKLLDAMYALESQPVEADYARAINYLRTQQKKRALIVLFTDLSGKRASDTLVRYFTRLIPHHLPMLVTIRDPALDQEAGRVPDSSEALYRRAVAEQLLDERRLVLDTLERQGVLTIDADAQHLSITVVNRYLQLKQRQMK